MIIYKATNLINGKVYIGQPCQLLCERKGGHIYDSLNYKKNNYINHAIRKYGKENFIWEQIDIAETQLGIDFKEIFWIRWYKSNNNKLGYNIAPGGFSNRGYKKTEKQKIALGIRMKNTFKEGKMTCFFKGKFGRDNPNYGKKRSDEVKLKISLKNKGKLRDDLFKPIRCIETNIIYNSIKKAAILLNIKESHLSAVLSGKGDSTKGLHWEFVNKEDKKIIIKISKENKCKRKIICLDNNIIYRSLREASLILNISHGHISSVCKGKRKTCGGYKFQYLSDYEKLQETKEPNLCPPLKLIP